MAITVALGVLTQCKKSEVEDNQETNQNSTTNSTFLAPTNQGTYWVYEYQYKDENDSITNWGIDTVSIVGDTMINNQTFQVLEGTRYGNPTTTYQRTSNGFALNGNGDTLFSCLNPGEVFREIQNEVLTQYLSCEEGMYSYEVPFGTFESYKVKNRAVTDQELYWAPEKITYSYYVDGIGMTYSEAFFASSPITIVQQLIDFQE